MSAPRTLPSDYILQRYVEKGMTHQQIAELVSSQERHPVTRGAVSTALSRAGMTNRVRYNETIPWRVKVAHQHSIHLWMLRVHHRLTHGGTATRDERKRYANWRARLDADGAVIMYVYDSPEGFYPVPRAGGECACDGELITLRTRTKHTEECPLSG